MKKFLILVFFVVVFGSCGTQSDDGFIGLVDSYNISILPVNAKNITSLGNGWVKFDINLEGKSRTFMFYRSRHGYKGFCAITELNK